MSIAITVVSLTTVLLHHLSDAWPDGAPCIHSAFESMNPLEATEHQGGLQLTNPPYTIDVLQKCYWKNQPIQVTLRGNSSSDRFRGFSMQPIVYRGPHQGKRMGNFLRLDDNGSWQQQCFRFKDSATHSHDEKKKHTKLWWQNDINEEDIVQFVATVVKAQKTFWVKSVLSVPIPPCQAYKDGFTGYVPPPVTAPPPVKTFKLETARIFDGNDNSLIRSMPSSKDPRDRKPKPQRFEDAFRSVQVPNFHRPTQLVRPQPSRGPVGPPVLPIRQPQVARPRQPPQPFRQPFQQQPFRPVQQQLQRPVPPMVTQRTVMRFQHQAPVVTVVTSQPRPRSMQPQTTQQVTFQPQTRTFSTLANTCVDRDPQAHCFARMIYCRTHEYMRINCARTCQYC